MKHIVCNSGGEQNDISPFLARVVFVISVYVELLVLILKNYFGMRY